MFIHLYVFSIGARPKFTKRNSMDSVDLWKYSLDKVTPLSHTLKECGCLHESPENPAPTVQHVLFLQNGENQDSDSMPRRTKSQLSQPGKRKGYPDSQSSDERPWLDSPVDTDDITVQVPPPVPVSKCGFQIRRTRSACRKLKMSAYWQMTGAANVTSNHSYMFCDLCTVTILKYWLQQTVWSSQTF